MTNTSNITVLAFGLALTGICPAQTVPYSRNALTNRDVVVLAKAGFNEDFIIETILSSRTQFDTRVDGLADLAKQGMTERLIRVMMNCDESRPAPNDSAPVVMAAPAPPATAARTKLPSREPKASTVSMAISRQAPYYQWTSCFWGLWKKKIGIGAGPQQPDPASQLGVMYQEVRAPRQYYVPLAQNQAARIYTLQTPVQP
jgi:hypothetical protein